MTDRASSELAGGGTTEDALLGGQIRLRQPADGYRVAVDPVLLASAVPATAGETVLDAGAGTGAAALCLTHRVTACRVTGLEIQPALAALAVENAVLNGLSDAVRVLEGDVSAPPPGIGPAGFDHVMTNPPYLRASESRLPPSTMKAIATVERDVDLASWLRICAGVVRPRGTVTVIHRADRLDEIVPVLSESCGELVVFPLWPKRGEDARRMIVRGTVGSETPLRIAAGLVLHERHGAFTREADAILRHGAPLEP